MTLFPWLVIFLLTAINALYVAAEFSVIAAAKSEIAALAKQGNARAASLQEVLQDGQLLDSYIAACQIGITLTSLIAGAYAQATIALDWVPVLENSFGLQPSFAHSYAILGVLVALTTIQVVLGELLPKSLALQFPEKTALLTLLPTRWSVTLYSGFIRLLNGSGFLLLRPFGVQPGGHTHVHSKAEIELLLAESHEGGALSPEEHQRLRRGLRLSTRLVRHLMVPRSEIHAIDADSSAEEILRRILDSPYSRLPVYRDSLDHILGTVSSKDLLSYYAKHQEVPSLERLLRPIPFIPERLRADRAVRFLQEQKSTKALVVSEFGGVQGIISIQDILAELLGDVGDELKEADPEVVVDDDGTVHLPGTLGLSEAEAWLGRSWEGTAATLGGYLIERLGRLPQEGERLDIDQLQFIVLEMSPTTIRTVGLLPQALPDAPSPEEES